MNLYIDPGTGSMLFAILIGIVGAVNFAFRSAWVKIKFILSGGNVKQNEADEKLPLVIFSDNKRYWPIFEPICRELDTRGVNVEYLTCSEDDPALKSDLSHVKTRFLGEGNVAFAKLNTLKAHVLLSTTPGLDVYQWKRSPEVDHYVHIFHTIGEAQLYRMFGTDYYDAILSSGVAQTQGVRELEELRDLPPKEIVTVGVPYMDVMADRLAELGPAPSETTILLAPTWGESGMFSRYGGKLIGDLLATGYHVIVRPHPQSFITETEMIEKIMAEYPESDQLEWSRTTDNSDALHRSDLLISDFSGIIFEFSLVYDKPVIYTSAHINKDPYDAWWVPNKTWTEDALPAVGINLETTTEDAALSSVIDRCLNDSALAQSRHALRDKAWSYRGNGATRVADYLVDTYKRFADAQVLQEA